MLHIFQIFVPVGIGIIVGYVFGWRHGWQSRLTTLEK